MDNLLQHINDIKKKEYDLDILCISKKDLKTINKIVLNILYNNKHVLLKGSKPTMISKCNNIMEIINNNDFLYKDFDIICDDVYDVGLNIYKELLKYKIDCSSFDDVYGVPFLKRIYVKGVPYVDIEQSPQKIFTEIPKYNIFNLNIVKPLYHFYKYYEQISTFTYHKLDHSFVKANKKN